MATFVLAFVVMALVMVIMAIGVIVNKKPIKGTCASLGNLGANGECVVCGKKPQTADDKSCKNLYYAADKPQKQV